MIIGITGAARVGKDSFYQFASEYFKSKGKTCERFAFADELKRDLEEFILSKTGISVWTENTEEKSIIRPLMVEYGKIQRNLSKGQCWIKKLIPALTSCAADYIFITDCRFKEFDSDESDFIKASGGKLIHITRYKTEIGFREEYGPANEEEAKNDPKMKAGADFRFSWEDFKNDKEKAREEVFNFLKKHKL